MTLVLAFVLMLILVAAMAVGLAFGRRPISGSCGGLEALGLDSACEICGGDPKRCLPARPRRAGRNSGAPGRQRR